VAGTDKAPIVNDMVERHKYLVAKGKAQDKQKARLLFKLHRLQRKRAEDHCKLAYRNRQVTMDELRFRMLLHGIEMELLKWRITKNQNENMNAEKKPPEEEPNCSGLKGEMKESHI